MMTSRRKVLKLIGGGVVVAASGIGGVIVTSGPSKLAREPWFTAGQETEFRRRALSYALLAPNPHNMQPWQVKLESHNALILYCDLSRRLPETDPYDRQITIGCGAFLELLKIAAAHEGYSTDIMPFPLGESMSSLDNRPIAYVRFDRQPAAQDTLFKQILKRRSNKEVYFPKDVSENLLSQLASAANGFPVNIGTTGNNELAERLRDLTWRAHEKEISTPAAYNESIQLMRFGADEVAAAPDGIELDDRLFSSLNKFGIMNKKTMADQASIAFKQGMQIYRDMAFSARAFAWLTNAGESRTDEINAGRAYVRFNLKATELSLGVHPWSQSLQEYPQMSGLYDEVHQLIGEGQRIQMLVRVGYAPPISPTPRWGVDKHIV